MEHELKECRRRCIQLENELEQARAECDRRAMIARELKKLLVDYATRGIGDMQEFVANVSRWVP